ncbi:glycosyltransferase family 2 protein [uncultured Fibrobacter sp.]|uniref:glycosyltransferase family 2 protein n=1 Tax=uncultured Fibrobacter sp. TaxID=261512 RepID=UPI0025F4D62E|nr:glycosyltransferase family 2 protein [uncultured Fibrobacter sp.]
MISVVLPSYNRAHILPRAIESILGQTYKDIELIIVDDGSSDNTAEVVGRFSDSRIVYVRQENAGACAARNNGIAHARGDYIAFQDSDDIWHQDKLEKQLATLQNTGADVVFCRMNRMVGGEKVGLVSDYFHEGFLPKDEVPMSIGTQTLVGKSEVFKQERFDSEMPRFQEFEMLVRAQKSFSIYCMEEPLVDYLLQKDSISANVSSIMAAWRLILKKHPDFLTQYKSSRARIARDIQLNAKTVKAFSTRMRLALFSLKFDRSPKTLARFVKWFLL